MVVHPPGKIQVSNFTTWYGKPVYVAGVRGTHNCLVPGVVELVELRRADTDVQAVLEPGEVGGLACGAEILHVLCLELNPLEDPVLPG